MLKKLSPLLVGACTVFTCAVAQAAPPETPESSSGMAFEGYVHPECSVDIPSVSSQNDNPIDYAITSTPAGGTNTDIDEYAGNEDTYPTAALEERAISLSANDAITFDCNTDTVDITVDLDSFTSPAFTNATSIDDITHTVGLSASTSGAFTSVEQGTAASDVFSETGVATNVDGDIVLTLSSTIAADGEELAAGNYGSSFTITVTAEDIADTTTAD